MALPLAVLHWQGTAQAQPRFPRVSSRQNAPPRANGHHCTQRSVRLHPPLHPHVCARCTHPAAPARHECTSSAYAPAIIQTHCPLRSSPNNIAATWHHTCQCFPSWRRRVLAHLIDAGYMFVPLGACIGAIAYFAWRGALAWSASVLVPCSLAVLAAPFLYDLVCLQRHAGTTPGKRWLGMRVVHASGDSSAPLSFAKSSCAVSSRRMWQCGTLSRCVSTRSTVPWPIVRPARASCLPPASQVHKERIKIIAHH